MSDTPYIKFVIASSLSTANTHILTVTITNSRIIPKELFVVEKSDRGSEYDTYARVASLYDITHIKTDRTTNALEYRAANMTKEFATLLEIKSAYTAIQEMLRDLVDYYKDSAIEYLDKEEVVEME